MNDHALDVLEYNDLLQCIAARTQTELGRNAILSMRPKRDLAAITANHGLYENCMELLNDGLRTPPLAFESITDVLRRAAPEAAVLAGDELVLCLRLIDRAADVGEYLDRDECRKYPYLERLAQRLDPLSQLSADLRQALDDEGHVADSASPELRELRRRARTLEHRIRKNLEHLFHVPEMENVLQERFMTVRNGRFVIPVRREAKGDLSGVIHDHSNSGQTVFIEPTATLEVGNELADTRLHEKDEVVRILARLSLQVRLNREALDRNQWVLGELDAALAVGAWAVDYNCSLPRFENRLQLFRARHPLLASQFRNTGRNVVPLDITFAPEARAMVITGSNTGGKTVALKTVGLIALAAQSGLPVPVDSRSRQPLFENVFADIGDEQSLSASLSTFSGHISHMTAILQEAGKGKKGPTLVLLDELGAGTDPLEGGALACAILLALVKKKNTVIATTHLGVVKSLAHERNDMTNAAVRFNIDTLVPEYTLDIGRPGSSHALQIARRLGMPDRVLDAAEDMLSGDHLRLESMLAQMEEEQRQLAAREKDARGAMKQLSRDRDELHAELETLRRERKRLMHEAYQQASGVVQNTRRQMEHMLRDLKTADDARQAADVARTARKALAKKREKLVKSIEETAARPDNPVAAADVTVGQTVWVEKLRGEGRVIAIDRGGKKVTVDVGGLRFSVPARELGAAAAAETPAAPPVVKVSRPRPVGQVSTELNLVGKRVAEAEMLLDAFINQALLAGLQQIRVVHGFGTGRLRKGVHAWLSRCKPVAGYRLGKHGEDPGGAGVTLVSLTK